jgi:hypothetical protein
MNNTLNSLYLSVSRLDRRQIQFILLIVSLALLVIGAGAPIGGGEGAPGSGG